MEDAWLPAAPNTGHTYRDRVDAAALQPRAGLPVDAVPSVSGFYAARYPHSSRLLWLQRLAAGEISRNGQVLRADGPLVPGDRLAWRRPPWEEPAVPRLPAPLWDDGDLVVFDKPSGLPVLPAGGFLEHTVLRQIERRVAAGDLEDGAGLPRPVHRLGRFTSGLLVCARCRSSRAWLSALLRDSTAATPGPAQPAGCRKRYRALIAVGPASALAGLLPGESLTITTPIGRRPHGRLGAIWAAGGERPLPAASTLTLLERREAGWLVEVAIASGRPHQIRIHTAAAGAPLLGDPLYRPGGDVEPLVLPGQGGYHLHAHRLSLTAPEGRRLELEAPLPPRLRRLGDGLGMAP
ncbi:MULTISPECIES: pseudouridine synthase [Aphanothece]|uniref:pseudouridine synthase n=1 Tax=Aphanothece TaxID=1121 RepID=UPI003984712F